MAERPFPWWVLASLPGGFTTWIGLLYAGIRARMPLLLVLAGVFFLLAVALSVASLTSPHPLGSTAEHVSGAIFFVTWLGGIAVSLAMVSRWQERMVAGEFVVEERIARRRELQELARERPDVAREMGLGRPDLPRAQHGGLIDINNASPHVIMKLPGVDYAMALEIQRVRRRIDGFSSLADMGAVMELHPRLVERLRDRVIFLPRL